MASLISLRPENALETTETDTFASCANLLSVMSFLPSRESQILLYHKDRNSSMHPENFSVLNQLKKIYCYAIM